ncbi:MAG: lysylphosphatidylglycerol synthase transmembrane domain-containing protein [Cyclonatronaceae bacterium]
MKRNILNIVVGVLIGALFIWLSLRNVAVDEFIGIFGDIRLGWIFPYLFIAFGSMLLRAERWRMLMQKEKMVPGRLNVNSAVALGMMINYAIPRLGEVSRAAYVARKEKISTSNVFGTVVLERIVDLVTMMLLLFIVLLFTATDSQTLSSLFGDDTVNLLRIFYDPLNAILLLTGLGISITFGYRILKHLLSAANREKARSSRLRSLIVTFVEGLISIRYIKNWPWFLVLTALMWFCYILMSYLPFYAFSLPDIYGLGFGDAIAVTAIASIGVVLPSPGGVGTYHYFVKQTLLVLCAVPAATGLAYAVVTHGAMMVVIFTTSLILLVLNQVRSPKNEAV